MNGIASVSSATTAEKHSTRSSHAMAQTEMSTAKLAMARIGVHMATDSPVVLVSYKLTACRKFLFRFHVVAAVAAAACKCVLIPYNYFLFFLNDWIIVRSKFPHRNHFTIPIQHRSRLQLDKVVHDAVALFLKPRNNWPKVNCAFPIFQIIVFFFPFIFASVEENSCEEFVFFFIFSSV